MTQSRSFFRSQVAARSCFLPYLLAKLPLSLVALICSLLRARSTHQPVSTVKTVLCLEAGLRGWELLEYKELYASAVEYLGESQVRKVIIDRDQDYLRQLRAALQAHQPTHYLYDPRTGSQDWVFGLWQALRIALLFASRGVTPIALLPDYSLRAWRAQSALVTCVRGAIVCFVSPRTGASLLPHARIVGPSLVPLSQNLLSSLDALLGLRQANAAPRAVFVGSMYEPRTSFLLRTQALLQARGHTLELQGRMLGTAKTSDQEYWSSICSADIVLTTALQIDLPTADWTWLRHLVYRYLEATACGALLVAEDVPGIARYFTPGVHFVACASAEEAAERIAYYLEHPQERQKIAAQGRKRARELIEANTYWRSIDCALGRYPLT